MGISREKKKEKIIQEIKSVFCMKFYWLHSFSISMRVDVKADVQFMSESASINNANESAMSKIFVRPSGKTVTSIKSVLFIH